MKNTRIILTSLCLIALAWGGTSCKKDKDIHNQGEKMTISAGIDQTSVGNTKTFLCPTASGVLVKWSANEKFTLFGNGATSGEEFTITNGVGNTSAQFDGAVPAGGSPYFAAYPASGSFNGTNTFTFTVNPTFGYVAEENAGTSANFVSVQQHNAPMVGKMTDNEHLQFHNAMSTIFLDLKGGAKVAKIVLTDLSGKPLNGTLTVTVNNDGTIASSTMSGGSNTLTLDLGEGVTLHKDKYSLFCFPVPTEAFADTKTENVQIDIYDVSNTIIKTIKKGLSAGAAANGAYQIVENKVRPYLLPEGFTVNSVGGERKIYFTAGNLWYDGSAFHFEENQWTTNTMNWSNANAANHLAHFYSCDKIENAIKQSGPSSATMFFSNIAMYTPDPNFEIDGVTGVYLIISEQDFTSLRDRKSTVGVSNKALYAMGTVNGVTGLILLPDNWDATLDFNYGSHKCTDNVYSGEDWEDMEYYGAVFLPISGYGKNGSSTVTVAEGAYLTSKIDTQGTSYPYSPFVIWLKDNNKPIVKSKSNDIKAATWASVRLVYYAM